MVVSSSLSALADSAGASLATSSSTSELLLGGRAAKVRLCFVAWIKHRGLVGSKKHVLLTLIHLCLMTSRGDRNHNGVLVLRLIKPIVMVKPLFFEGQM